ncbi:MAG: HAMP domain-containing histidine kinase, partial [Treponema sp.]|nr:HAMP domain-containing histidine kinase [Treponema sp.]
MKIKTQFKLFIVCIVAVPLIFGASIAGYNYLRNPERMFMDGYKRSKTALGMPLSKRDVRTVKEMIHHFPPDAEMLVLANHSEVLLSTIPDLKDVQDVCEPTLIQYIRKTSGRYFYQISSPELTDTDMDITVITRMERNKDKRHKPPRRIFETASFFVIFFELVCITFIIYVSVTISRSITMLEKNTERITAGELDKPLEKPKDVRTTNEITNLANNLEKMRVSLKEAADRKLRFIMGISHDLRTPVAVIKGYTEAMSDGVMEGESQKKALEIIGTKTNQLEEMINTLINFVKLDSTDWREQLQKQRIKPILEDFAQSCVNTGDVFKRTVTAEVDISDNTEIPFNAQLFQRALENLFSNAVRYTKDGDLISFSAKEAGSEIFVTIADSGIGIAEEEIEHIFDLFYRATGSRREEGMGIGLSVVKNIIDTHGWKIDVQSKKDE